MTSIGFRVITSSGLVIDINAQSYELITKFEEPAIAFFPDNDSDVIEEVAWFYLAEIAGIAKV